MYPSIVFVLVVEFVFEHLFHLIRHFHTLKGCVDWINGLRTSNYIKIYNSFFFIVFWVFTFNFSVCFWLIFQTRKQSFSVTDDDRSTLKKKKERKKKARLCVSMRRCGRQITFDSEIREFCFVFWEEFFRYVIGIFFYNLSARMFETETWFQQVKCFQILFTRSGNRESNNWAALYKNKASVNMFSRTRTIYPSRPIKGFRSKFVEDCPESWTPEEDRRVQRSKWDPIDFWKWLQ